jgi:two-component system phosphate regulon response regulator PhoB
MPARILIIEDDATLVELLRYNFEAVGYEVTASGSAEEGGHLLAAGSFDLVVLDWMLPDLSGLELCARLRRPERRVQIPILMLTARSEEADRVRGLRTGADDYVVKPFSVPELMARVDALLRRASPDRISDVLEVGELKLDRAARWAFRAGRGIDLGPTEYRLLEALLESPGRVLSRNQLIDRVWGTTSEIDDRTVDVHIGRLRRSLIRGDEYDPIRTVRGAGYAIGGDSGD